MSQTFFSKLDDYEKTTRLNQIANSKGLVTVWIKGKKDKYDITAFKYDKERSELVLDSKEDYFPSGSSVLVSFELRGMNFFSEAVFKKSVGDYTVLILKGGFFKSEKRSSYRLMTYPIYEVYSHFDMTEYEVESNVVELKKMGEQTGLFKSFIKLIESKEGREDEEPGVLKVRVQDLSTTGLSLHVSELESPFFIKDRTFHKVNIVFTDERIEIPEVKVVYVVCFISNDKSGQRRFKIGLNFPNLPAKIDDQLGKKINKLLREIDANKDFENLVK